MEGPDKMVNKYKDLQKHYETRAHKITETQYLEGPKDQCRNRDEGNFQLNQIIENYPKCQQKQNIRTKKIRQLLHNTRQGSQKKETAKKFSHT